MKYYRKQMPGFCVTYLHNPLECPKCSEMMEDDFRENFYKFYLEKGKIVRPSPVNENVPVIFSDTCAFTEKTNILKTFSIPIAPLCSSILKKKSFRKTSKVKTSQSPKFCRKIFTDKNQKLNTVKKKANKSVQKPSDDKIPGKGTLKRKKWFFKQLQKKNDNHEDDLFEDGKYGHFPMFLEDESQSNSSDTYTGLKTPVFPFSFSPRNSTPSPDYIDCYSPDKLTLSERIAEEFEHKFKKKRKLDLPIVKSEPETPPNVTETKPEKILQTLLEVEKILMAHVDNISDTEEDQYFSDILL